MRTKENKGQPERCAFGWWLSKYDESRHFCLLAVSVSREWFGFPKNAKIRDLSPLPRGRRILFNIPVFFEVI